jgi:hypothetical protein
MRKGCGSCRWSREKRKADVEHQRFDFDRELVCDWVCPVPVPDWYAEVMRWAFPAQRYKTTTDGEGCPCWEERKALDSKGGSVVGSK